MSNLTIFNNEQFGEIRTIIKDGEPWFIGKDVCAAFGDTNHNRSLSRVDAEDKETVEITDSLGRKQSTKEASLNNSTVIVSPRFNSVSKFLNSAKCLFGVTPAFLK